MSEIFWTRVRELFEAAADAPPAERETVLRAGSNGDDAVYREAAALLAADATGFLEHHDPLSIPPSLLRTSLAAESRIGGYRVTHLVGQGGMGEVYEAFRADADFTKRFALKVLRAGVIGNASVRRFEQERRILARLEHRNIAALLDGGLTDDHRPYLVMEFVEGVRITDWCRVQRLTTDQRLQLFRQVCGAVSYAHRNLIVHRDIKPGNILVAGDGTVKLLDFGIAKVLDDDAASDDAPTRAEGVALTPEYAAPEQLEGGVITTATDVYALGLLLFEILTGRRPFAAPGIAFADLKRSVLTRDPPPPSESLARNVAGSSDTGARSELRGDLDAIVLRALRVLPGERYGSVDELAEDLRRHDAGLPVSAMRGRRGYRLRKFIGRHRGGLIAAAIIAAVIIGGVIATVAQAHRADVQRGRAEATNGFLTEMLRSVDPSQSGRGVLMADVLDTAAARIGTGRTMVPDVEASLREAIGASYTALGKYDAAEPHLRRALALRQQQHETGMLLAGSLQGLASMFDSRGEYARADTLYRQALATLPATTDSAVNVESIDLLEQMARMQSHQGDFTEAANLLRQVIARQRAALGAGSPQVGRTLSDLGVTLLQLNQLVPAESAGRAAVKIFDDADVRSTPEGGHAIGRLASTFDMEGKRAEADSAYRQALTILSVVQGPTHPDVTWIRYNYAQFLSDGQRWPEAISEADSVLALRGAGVPETQPTIAATYMVRGQARIGIADHAGAERDMREGVALRKKYLPAGHWLIGTAESVLGEELVHNDRLAEGVALLTDGCRLVARVLGPDHPQTKRTRGRLLAVQPNAKSCS